MKNLPTPPRTAPRSRTGLRAALLAGLAPWLLVACGNRNIDLVKAQTVPKGGYTYGQALDNNKGCADTQWKATKDDKQRDIVSFHCEVGIPDSVMDASLQALDKKLAEDHKSRTEGFGITLERAQKDLALRLEICSNEVSSAEVARGDMLEKLAELKARPLQPGMYGRPGETLEQRQQEMDRLLRDIQRQEIPSARCIEVPQGLDRAIAHMDKIRPDYMAASEGYTEAIRKETQAYYRQKRPTKVDIAFLVQGEAVRMLSFDINFNGEQMDFISHDIIHDFLGPDDTRLPKILMDKVRAGAGSHLREKLPFPFHCNQYYCDRDQAMVDKNLLMQSPKTTS